MFEVKLKLLRATRDTQGQREDDFCFTVEGELVRFPFDCARCGCGCKRSMVGIESRKGTTTMKVELVPTSEEGLARYLVGSWGDEAADVANPEVLARCRRAARELIEAARPYTISSIVERRDGVLQIRRTGYRLPSAGVL